jgi:hypothetical protein
MFGGADGIARSNTTATPCPALAVTLGPQLWL